MTVEKFGSFEKDRVHLPEKLNGPQVWYGPDVLSSSEWIYCLSGRDVDEIRECGYPLWSTGVCPRRSRNEFTFGSINEKINIGEVEIAPNDIIVADSSGVVCVPKDLISDILENLEKIAHQETILEDQVLRGTIQNWDEL